VDLNLACWEIFITVILERFLSRNPVFLSGGITMPMVMEEERQRYIAYHLETFIIIISKGVDFSGSGDTIKPWQKLGVEIQFEPSTKKERI
jgi:hypothetical protein